jgi:hypothetical protein
VSSFSVPIPVDDDGFLRRECPHCLQQFKWHHGPTAEQPEGETDPPVYFCPLCGASAASDHWWTTEQLEYARQLAIGPLLREAYDTAQETFRGAKGVTISTSAVDEPVEPDALHEANDMVIVAPPCHRWEPIKVPEERLTRVFCLRCGSPFAA